MTVPTEEALLNELTHLYGRDFAVAMVNIEKNKYGNDTNKLLGGIRALLTTVGGRRYAQEIYERLVTTVGGSEE